MAVAALQSTPAGGKRKRRRRKKHHVCCGLADEEKPAQPCRSQGCTATSPGQQDGDAGSNHRGEKQCWGKPWCGNEQERFSEATPRVTFGCHHLSNTAPTPLTAQTWPHAVLVVSLLGYFSHISCGQGYLESSPSMPNPVCLLGFPAAEPDSTAQCP